MVIRMSEIEMSEHAYYGRPVRPGEVYTVSEVHPETNPSHKSYTLLPGDRGGVSGNMGSVKLYHGWRGTTCGFACYALGVHEVVAIVRYKNGNFKITLGPDLRADFE